MKHFALALFMFATASPAFAQREVEAANANPHDRIVAGQAHDRSGRTNNSSSTRDLLPPAERAAAERRMRDFAQCVVRGDPAKAQQILATKAGSAEERSLLLRVAQGRNGCLGKGTLRMAGNWMRGALAEQLYLRTYPQPVSEAARPTAEVRPAGEGAQVYHAYADCVVARNAPMADTVLRATPGSEAEKAAYRDSMPTLSSCLAGGPDKQLAIDRTVLRGYLAESLYAHRRKGSQG